MATESALKWHTSAHAVFSLSYHIVFCPKYRRPVLSPLEDELKALFQEKAMEMGLTIKAMEIRPTMSMFSSPLLRRWNRSIS
jgi:REP element-mobilizing transposase RayT